MEGWKGWRNGAGGGRKTSRDIGERVGGAAGDRGAAGHLAAPAGSGFTAAES